MTTEEDRSEPARVEIRYLDLDLEAVTPLSIGGAARQAEIRPPSFRGTMRYWLRALLGGVFGPDLATISAVERAVFGYQAHASLVALRVLQGAAAAAMPPAGEEFPGVGYLLYSLYQNRRDTVLPGQRFRLRLQTRPFRLPAFAVDDLGLDADLGWDLAAATLWLITRLGGPGSRARRGASSIRFTAEPDEWPAALPPACVRAATPQAYAEELAADLADLRRAFGWTPVAALDGQPSFTVLHPDCCQILVLDQAYPSWQAALDAVGRAFQAFRSRQPDDYATVKGALTQPRWRINAVKRAVFGLPLMFFFSSLYKQLQERGVPPRDARSRASATILPRRGQMRASPLWFRVVQLNSDAPAYAVQLALFRSQFTQDGMVTLRPADRSIAPLDFRAPADYSYVQEWFDYLPTAVAPTVQVRFE